MLTITTHDNADFDSLAAMLAAAKLYPDAVALLPQRLNRNLRDFLALYGGELPFVRPDATPRRRITRLILVDTQTVPPIKGFKPDTAIHVIDHHPRGPGLPSHATYEGGDAGATTTLLVSKLCESSITLTPIEATLLLLGIYEDTGSLSYAGTTSGDLRAAAWLLEQGANLDVVNNFLHHPLSEAQHALYHQLLSATRSYEFAGQTVVIATATTAEYVEEISTLAHHLCDVYDPAALFVLVRMRERIQLVARSMSEAIDVARIASEMNGGGHSRAAAALIESTDLDATLAKLVALLQTHVRPALTVRQIMSRGVQTLEPGTPVAEADALMRRYGHEGFPVVQEGTVVGVITRREIDQALHHKLGRSPIEAYMRKGRIAVSPEDAVEKVQALMLEHGVGQVAVVEDERIIGIVTRTDLIKAWGSPLRSWRQAEIVARLEAALPAALLDLLRDAGRSAREMECHLYLVGGFVRDLLLGVPNLDIDLVVEGDAIALAKRLAERHGGRVHSHARFGTAKWMLKSQVPGQKLGPVAPDIGLESLDFVTARREFYAHPTALPQVERSSIKQDLHRRDFTINTLAISLDEATFGQLLDFFGGESDLSARLIRVLHSLSFVEDPTRILRAVRLEQRLGFAIEPRTAELMDDALDLLRRVSGERVRHELFLIFQEAEPERAIARLGQVGVLERLHPKLAYGDAVAARFHRLRAMQPVWASEAQPAPLHYLALLVFDLPIKDVEAVAARLRLSREQADVLRELITLRDATVELSQPDLKSSRVYRLLQGYLDDAQCLLWVATESDVVRERVELYHRQLANVRLAVDGKYLRALGIKPGPVYRRVLARVLDAVLDGEIRTRQEQEEMAKKMVEDSDYCVGGAGY